MKKMVNLTKKVALANMVNETKLTERNNIKEINKELSGEMLYPSTAGEFDGLDTAYSHAVLWLDSLGTVKPYKDGLCAKQGRKKICEVYLVTADNRVHVYADSDMIKGWVAKKYRGFLTETDRWSRFEFLYDDFLKMVQDSIF